MPESILWPSPIELTEKQRKLLDALTSVISENEIKLNINTAPSEMGEPTSVDIEHDEQGNLVGIGLCDGTVCWYYTQIEESLIIRLTSMPLIAHNGVSDFECLRTWGIAVKDTQLIHDTMLIGHIIDSSQKDYSLKAMATRELGISYPSYDDIVGKRGLKTERVTLDKQPLELVSKYNACDTYVTYKLYERQLKLV